jgi:hypothetical protein
MVVGLLWFNRFDNHLSYLILGFGMFKKKTKP